jgi:septal ring factor EnvC (AmiA/AmiB activator)
MEISRIDQRQEAPGSQAPDPQLVELLRRALAALPREAREGVMPPAPNREEAARGPEERIPLFWKMCTAALLSISAMIAVTLYNQLNSSAGQARSDIGQLRAELGQFRTDLVSKEDYNSHIEQTVHSIKEVQANNKTAMDTWRDRMQDQRATVSDLRYQIKETERDLQRMREELALLEQREAGAPVPSPDSKKGP